MKIKKFLLGGFILVFAIGSAIASAFTPTPPHVKGKTSINPEVWKCVPINQISYCNDTQGMFECVVIIPINGINTTVLAYKGPGYIDSKTSCTIPLRQNTSPSINGTPEIPILEVWPTDLRQN